MAEEVRLEGGPFGESFTHTALAIPTVPELVIELDGQRHLYKLDEDRVYHYGPRSTNHKIYKYEGLAPETITTPEPVEEEAK